MFFSFGGKGGRHLHTDSRAIFSPIALTPVNVSSRMACSM